MTALRSLLLAPCLLLAAGTASAAPGEGPPAGWEAPPQLPPRVEKAANGKPDRPACCGYDVTCCTRQMEMNGTAPDLVGRVVEVRFADLPELVVKEAPAGGPPISGAPGVRIIDGQGRPAPWPDRPRREVRVLPVGRYGDLTWGEGWDAAMPFFSDPQRRGLGYGVVRNVGRETVEARDILTGKIIFTTVDKGPGESIVIDYVKGALEGTPEVKVTRWGHVEAAPVTDGFVHAFRGWPPAEALAGEPPAEPGAAVTFVLPGIIVEFESKDAKHSGHSRQESYKTLTLPVGAGRSGLVSLVAFDDELAHWFPRPAGAPKPADRAQLVLSSSQTSAEAEPRVRVVFLAPNGNHR